jgi:CheY-like chemotaxis protein
MLQFTKTETGTARLVSFDIKDLVNDSIEFTQPRWKNEAQAKGINYKISTEGMITESPILCNPTELREVFINIINNALDAMPEGGSLSFSSWSGDDSVFVSISDTGAGMSEDVKKRIFDPFYTTKMPVGTGLGMSMAYGLITRHGGSIKVESEIGKGSTFTLQFPVTMQAINQTTVPKPKQEKKKKNLHILVVDDEEAIRNILDKYLSRSGHMIHAVDNGADAIKLVKKEVFDLVLCDLAMPHVFGYDVIKALNLLEKRPKIGIITGWGENLRSIKEVGEEIDFIVRKPFNFSELTKKINEEFGNDN